MPYQQLIIKAAVYQELFIMEIILKMTAALPGGFSRVRTKVAYDAHSIKTATILLAAGYRFSSAAQRCD
jgi:hypothetical protein